MRKHTKIPDLLTKLVKLLTYQNKDEIEIEVSVLLPFPDRRQYRTIMWYVIDPKFFNYECWDGLDKNFVKGKIPVDLVVLEYYYFILYKEVQDRVKMQLLDALADEYIDKEIFLK